MKRYNGIEQDDEGAFVYYDDALAAIEQARKEEGDWKAHVLDALVVNWTLSEENQNDARKAISDLLSVEVQMALDPAISSDARSLIERGRKEERDECEALARSMFNRAANGDEIADAIRSRGVKP